MWSQVGTIAPLHLISGETVFLLSRPCFISSKPPPPPSSLAEAFVWTDEQRRSPIRSTPDGPAPMQHRLSYSRIVWCHWTNLTKSAPFLTFDPRPSIGFPWAQSISRNNCRQVTFSLPTAKKPGSLLRRGGFYDQVMYLQREKWGCLSLVWYDERRNYVSWHWMKNLS